MIYVLRTDYALPGKMEDLRATLLRLSDIRERLVGGKLIGVWTNVSGDTGELYSLYAYEDDLPLRPPLAAGVTPREMQEAAQEVAALSARTPHRRLLRATPESPLR